MRIAKVLGTILAVIVAVSAMVVLYELGTDGEYRACVEAFREGFRKVERDRTKRYLGKPDSEAVSRCRGGVKALAARSRPWTDWADYHGTGDADSKSGEPELPWLLRHLQKDGIGIDGALTDMEYQRIELIRHNLYDNTGTYPRYVLGGKGADGKELSGRVVKVWPQLELPADHPDFGRVDHAAGQTCQGELIRHRTLSGICNDMRNPLMGSVGLPFARNVQFEETFPDRKLTEEAINRHGNRLAPLVPDPQVISRKLLTRSPAGETNCNDGYGLPDESKSANCPYRAAPFFNVIAAYWIQFMTHDWFSHLNQARNDVRNWQPMGCATQKVGNQDRPLSAAEAKALGCRPGDQMERALFAQSNGEDTFEDREGHRRLARAPKTTPNLVTAWWDASQIYGYDPQSLGRVQRDPHDRAKLLMVPVEGRNAAGDAQGYLPVLAASPSNQPEWAGQEAVAFPDNWSVGLSFLHNLFAREHNNFVSAFREHARKSPGSDSGLRDPSRPDAVITYAQVGDDDLFEVTRLVLAAEIAKIHTVEWTTQLLYDEPLYIGMNSNWDGVFDGSPLVERALGKVIGHLAESEREDAQTTWYSVFAAGPGIVGNRSQRPDWSFTKPETVNGGVNHFGSPFNFPEEFTTVYRLHALVPDLLEYRDFGAGPDAIQKKVPVVATFRGRATAETREKGLANWALSLGRQRLGLLELRNHPRFLQNLQMPGRLDGRPGLAKGEIPKLDVAALDIIRDRERGLPRYNEFRRQYGLKHLTRFDDFIDPAAQGDALNWQKETVALLREVYGTHICDETKIISRTVQDARGAWVNDCLGRANGSAVDNIEDLDTVVGMISEYRRPHGFAISETQFQVFILNASRRLYSDRFFTSSFRAEFYTTFGLDWVKNNGPGGKLYASGRPNGHTQQVSPLKRVLLRAMPELEPELRTVVNAFDPWARDRGEYYSIEWKPRPDAHGDESFRKQ